MEKLLKNSMHLVISIQEVVTRSFPLIQKKTGNYYKARAGKFNSSWRARLGTFDIEKFTETQFDKDVKNTAL